MVKKATTIGAVSYLNARPLIYGFENGMMKDEIRLVRNYPAVIAGQLMNDEIDIGLVPVAIIPQLPRHFIIGNYCIGAVGPVASVCLFSDVPLHEIKTVLLDYQSRTSVALLKVLMKMHWNIEPLMIQGEPGYESKINGTTAGLVIGDRAFRQKTYSSYEYDLAEAWVAMTGLPFVFAAWISNKPMDDGFIESFNLANAEGLKNLDKIVARQTSLTYNLMDYYTKHISYPLDEAKLEGMNRFLALL
jgi:chorismate dehydratase